MNENTNLLKNENIFKLLIRFTIPASAALLISALYNVIDAVFVGRAVGTMGIGALAIVYPIQVIFIAFAQLVGVGSSSILSRSYGSKDLEKAQRIAADAYAIILAISVAFTVICLVFAQEILGFFGATKALLPLAMDYHVIIVSGSTLLTSGYVISALLRSEGNIKTGVAAMIIGAVINIILDPILIFVLDLGIKGAAYASVISQFITLSILVAYILKGKSILKIQLSHLSIKWKEISSIIAIGSSSFIRLIVGSVIVIVINNILSVYGGDLYISIYGSLTRTMTFLMMPVLGLIQALQPILGFNYGLKDMKRSLDTIKISSKMALVIGIIITLIVEIFAIQVIGLFSKDGIFISEGVAAFRIVFIIIPIVCVQMIASGVFQALGKATHALVLSIIRQFTLLPLLFILPIFISNSINGIWLAFPVSDFIATVITMIILITTVRRIESKVLSKV